jgi:exopolyphosphatase / guanosine-5'-triphosphate,3'-diphosphate pyrophosphatase
VGHTRELDLEAVTEERRPVFPGGVVILTEIVDALGIQQLRFVEGALRDGLLYDMVGRMTRSDARERTVSSMQRRYHVDLEQAGRVEATALAFLSQVMQPWELGDPLAELSLKWAARLHEIGLDVAHSGYHRHGAYLLENADMPGFAREEQQLLARLVGSHRRKLAVQGLEDLIPPWDRRAVHLIVLLRLAVLLHRGRSGVALPNIELAARGGTLELRFPARWLKEHPLTVADLQLEIEFLRPHGIRLRVFSGNRAG